MYVVNVFNVGGLQICVLLAGNQAFYIPILRIRSFSVGLRRTAPRQHDYG